MPDSDSLVEIYGSLVRNTRYTVAFNFHYFCTADEANLDEILKERDLVFATSCRPVPIQYEERVRNGKTWTTKTHAGAIVMDQIPDRQHGAKQLRPVEFRKAKKDDAVSRWEKTTSEDLRKIDVALQNECRKKPAVQYICLPEFSLPYLPIRKMKKDPQFFFSKKDDHPDWWEKALKDVQADIFRDDRFVCLGSAHASFQESDKTSPAYQNMSVVFPCSNDASEPASEIFADKRNKLPSSYKSNDVTITATANGAALDAQFIKGDFSVRERGELDDLSKSQKAAAGDAAISYTKEAFDFFHAICAASIPPQYVSKNNPARRMGEFLDPTESIHVDVFVTRYGVAAVLICYDVFDPSVFLALARLYWMSDTKDGSFKHPSPEIILIPSFNKHPDFVKACRALSFETQSIVVYTSSYASCPVQTEVFICGMKLADLATELKEGNAMTDTPDPCIRVARVTRSIFEKAKNKSNIGQLRLGLKDYVGDRRLGRSALI